jgi:hypothetical protein
VNRPKPENRLLIARACSLYFEGCTTKEIADKLGLPVSATYRLLRQRASLDPLRLDPRALEARARKLQALEDQLAITMPGALAGDLDSAQAAIKAIKARCRLFGFS